MSKNVDVLIIGGGPAGIISAVAARKYYPDKKIAVMKSIENGVIPCGIPYMFSSLKNPDENKLGNAALEKNDVEVMVDEAVKIDRIKKIVTTKNGQNLSYEKLILATGSNPITPPIEGMDKKGVYAIYKDLDYLKNLIEDVKKVERVVILGGGFIGVELADEIAKIKGIKVSLIEMMPSLLPNSFDPEFASNAKQVLEKAGVAVLTDTKVEAILGDGKVEKVRLSSGEEIKVDKVIMGIGGIPNTKIAAEAGLELGKGKGILVDEYMRTADPDVFAIGDCAAKRDFYTHRETQVMLASTATAEARVAGANLYSLKVVRENKGTIAIYSTYVNGLVLGSAGLTENSAKKEGFEIAIGTAEGMDKHPGTLPGAKKIKVKLIFSRNSGIILGGQVSGGISCGEIINLIGIAIQKRMAAVELETLQMATHPYLTSSPTIYPVVLAAQNAMGKCGQ